MSRIFSLALFCVLLNTSFSQLDSASVSVSFVTDSTLLSDTLMPSEILQASIWVNDTDFVGQVMVSVYDQASHSPIARVKYTHQQMVDQNYIVGNLLVLPVGRLYSSGQYTIDVQLQNFQLAYLAPIEISYP